MKKKLHFIWLSLAFLLVTNILLAQTDLAPDQNPSFAVSRDKYILKADSLNQYQSTTVHTTYKAYDWYEARKERKQQRLQFNQQLQLERARNNYWFPYTDYNYHNSNRYRYNRNCASFCFWRF